MLEIEETSKVKVLVIGDVMLDRYWWGTVSRISPEAPVPIVKLKKSSYAVGGAANVAANIAGLGATAYLIGLVGEDEESKELRKLLSEANVSPDYLINSKNRPTIVKTRIIAHSQQVLRLDQEEIHDCDDTETNECLKTVSKLIDETDVIVISDYAKGFITENIISRLITTANSQNKPILIDPKGKNYEKYRGATLLTPNQKEAAEACSLEESTDNLIEIAGGKLIANLHLKYLLITQGENGMTLIKKGGEQINLKASARLVYDVTGAGDTVIAALSVALGAGKSIERSAEISNIAAGLVVEQVGTTIITNEMLEKNK